MESELFTVPVKAFPSFNLTEATCLLPPGTAAAVSELLLHPAKMANDNIVIDKKRIKIPRPKLSRSGFGCLLYWRFS